MADYEDISYRVDGAVVRITVERPARLNAYRNGTADELTDAFRRAEADKNIRAIIHTGSGRAFGAGFDLSTVDPSVTPELDVVLERHFNPVVRQMRGSRLPIVSAINGPCAGAAVGIALAGDIVIAARSAYLYEPFVGIALVPDAGNTLFLPRLVGRVRASAMMLLGEKIGAEEAASWGLVWRVYDDAALMGEAEKIAAKLAGLTPGAIAGTKRLIAEAADFGQEAQLGLERDLQGEAGRSSAVKEAVAAFFEKRRAAG